MIPSPHPQNREESPPLFVSEEDFENLDNAIEPQPSSIESPKLSDIPVEDKTNTNTSLQHPTNDARQTEASSKDLPNKVSEQQQAGTYLSLDETINNLKRRLQETRQKETDLLSLQESQDIRRAKKRLRVQEQDQSPVAATDTKKVDRWVDETPAEREARHRKNKLSREYHKRKREQQKREQQRAAFFQLQQQNRTVPPNTVSISGSSNDRFSKTLTTTPIPSQSPWHSNSEGLDILQPREQPSPESSSGFVRLDTLKTKRGQPWQTSQRKQVVSRPNGSSHRKLSEQERLARQESRKKEHNKSKEQEIRNLKAKLRKIDGEKSEDEGVRPIPNETIENESEDFSSSSDEDEADQQRDARRLARKLAKRNDAQPVSKDGKVPIAHPQFAGKRLPDDFISPVEPPLDSDECSTDGEDQELIYHYRVETQIELPAQWPLLDATHEVQMSGPYLNLLEANAQALRQVSKYQNPYEMQGGHWQLSREGMIQFSLQAGESYVAANVTRKIAGKSRLLGDAATVGRRVWMVLKRIEILETDTEISNTDITKHTNPVSHGKILNSRPPTPESLVINDPEADQVLQVPQPTLFMQNHLGTFTDLTLANQKGSNEWLSVRKSYMPSSEYNLTVGFPKMEGKAREELVKLEEEEVAEGEGDGGGLFWKSEIFGGKRGGTVDDGGDKVEKTEDGKAHDNVEESLEDGQAVVRKKITVWVEEVRIQGPRN